MYNFSAYVLNDAVMLYDVSRAGDKKMKMKISHAFDQHQFELSLTKSLWPNSPALNGWSIR